jgi:hypothetical protein
MSKVIFESRTILQPRLDANHIEVTQSVIRELKEMHPEWEDLHWNVNMWAPDVTKPAHLHISVTDIHAIDHAKVLLFLAILAVIVAYYYFL